MRWTNRGGTRRPACSRRGPDPGAAAGSPAVLRAGRLGRGGPRAPLGDSPVGALVELLLEDAVERLLVQLERAFLLRRGRSRSDGGNLSSGRRCCRRCGRRGRRGSRRGGGRRSSGGGPDGGGDGLGDGGGR